LGAMMGQAEKSTLVPKSGLIPSGLIPSGLVPEEPKRAEGRSDWQ
jgi:hypothetical protein